MQRKSVPNARPTTAPQVLGTSILELNNCVNSTGLTDYYILSNTIIKIDSPRSNNRHLELHVIPMNRCTYYIPIWGKLIQYNVRPLFGRSWGRIPVEPAETPGASPAQSHRSDSQPGSIWGTGPYTSRAPAADGFSSHWPANGQEISLPECGGCFCMRVWVCLSVDEHASIQWLRHWPFLQVRLLVMYC